MVKSRTIPSANRYAQLKMRNRLIYILLISLYGCSADSFEGIVRYETTYKSKVEGVLIEDLLGPPSSIDSIYFKDGYYLQKSTTDYMNYLLWRSEDTTQYFRNKASSDTLWFDKTNSHPTVIDSSTIVKKATTILGYKCHKLSVYRGGSIYTYYYNPNFYLDPEFYKEYTNSSKHQVMTLMKSPYLRLHIEYPGIEMDMIATDIVIEKLSDSIFELPNKGVRSKYDY